MYNYLKDNDELGITYISAWGYSHCEEYDGEMDYCLAEVLDLRYVYTILKGDKGDVIATEDTDGDFVITLNDATAVLQSYAENAVTDEPIFNEAHDVNGDGKVDIDDATAVLDRYAKDAAGL